MPGQHAVRPLGRIGGAYTYLSVEERIPIFTEYIYAMPRGCARPAKRLPMSDKKHYATKRPGTVPFSAVDNRDRGMIICRIR